VARPLEFSHSQDPIRTSAIFIFRGSAIFIFRGYVIIDGDDVAKAKKKQEALAEHVASHPEDAGLTVDDFDWIERTVIRPRVLTDG
jgi:hypothetical protein